MSSVLAPLGVLLLIGAVFLVMQQRKAVGAPISIGSMYAAVILLYGTYPILVYVLLNGFYTPFNDGRLFGAQPTPDEVGRVFWYYTIYLAAFCVGYLALAPRTPARTPISLTVEGPALWALFTLFLTFRATIVLADLFFAADAGSYQETYLRYRHLPLVFQQLLGHLEGITSVLALAVVAVLCHNWRRWWWVVIGWLALELGVLWAGMGARTQFVLLCLAALVSYHYLHKPVSTKTLVYVAVALLVAFLGIGILRQYGGGGVAAIGIEVIASASEFESLFANAYDVERLVAFGEIDAPSMAVTVYFGDFLIVPQQLLPFAKTNLPNWYIQTFYFDLAERGVGFAFGSVAESLVGTGWPDLIWRGLVVGAALCWFDRIARKTELPLWSFVFFLWLVTSCYQIFRATTFALVPVFVFRFLPAVIAVALFAHLLRAAASRPADTESAGRTVGLAP